MATDRRWYLVAYDLDRADWRTFRVDRTSSVKVPGHTFAPRPLDDPARMVAEAISTTVYEHRAVVRMEAPEAEIARLIPPYAGIVRSTHGDHTVVELGADDFDYLASYLVGLGLNFEVLEPAGLRVHLVALSRRLAQAHREPGDPAPA